MMTKFFTPKSPNKCGGKNCYTSRDEADAVAREQELLNMMSDLELRSYRCIICGQWHLSRKKSENAP